MTFQEADAKNMYGPVNGDHFNDDFRDFISALNKRDVEYISLGDML
jgi:hypothetical protein